MDNHEKWQAVINNDETYDGKFYYAVKSTGIFCRPSCKSRLPKRENLNYYTYRDDAINAGYRPCKRCRPDLIEYQPILDIAKGIKLAIDKYFNEREELSAELAKIGVSQHRMVEIFKKQYNSTPNEYIDNLKIRSAKEQLVNSDDSIINISLSLGFDSITAFYGFFRKYTEMTPKEFRALENSPKVNHDLAFCICETAIGKMMLSSNGKAITSAKFYSGEEYNPQQSLNPILDEAVGQLDEYFLGKRKAFDIPLEPQGTSFQFMVWKELQNIPYGETFSYKQVAQSIGNSGASRAVGMANNKNPLLIFIPCHRVVGANGELVGYAGGLEIKKRLLELEQLNK